VLEIVYCDGNGFLKLYADKLKKYNIVYNEYKAAFLETDNFNDIIDISKNTKL
jgi:hypothetical protein